MKRLALIVLLLLLVSCTGHRYVVVTATPGEATLTAIPSPAPTIEPTPTGEGWLDEPYNAGAYMDGEPQVAHVGRPGIDPDILFEYPPSWTLVGDPHFAGGTGPWPSAFKKLTGLTTYYDISVSDRGGQYGWQTYVSPCDRCLLIIRADYYLNNKPEFPYAPGQISFGVSALPTSGNDGTCQPTVMPLQSPQSSEFSSNDWRDQMPVGLWLVSFPNTDALIYFWFQIPSPVFTTGSYIHVKSLEVRRVGPGYGSDPIEVTCP